MSSTIFKQFLENCLVQDNSVTSTVDIHNEYIKYTGSKSGRNNLYKYLESINGVTREKNSFCGISIKKVEDNTNMKIEEPKKESTPVKTMSAFEEAMLEIAKKKEEREAREAAERKEKEEREERERKEKEEREAAERKEKEEREAAERKEKEGREAREAAERKEKEEREERERKEKEEREAAFAKMKEERKAFYAKAKEERKAREAIERRESEERMLAKKLECKQKIAQMYIDDKENDRRLIREENSKNRQMYLTTKFNKYLDLKVYGSPAKQYITEESLIDVAGYDNYAMTSKINIKEIQEDVKKVSEDVTIYEGGKAKEVKAIEVSKVTELLEDIQQVSDDLKERVAKIPEVAVRDENRNIISKYEEKKNVINEDRKNNVKYSAMTKDKYLRAENEICTIGNEIQIKCSCCKSVISYEEGACHRGHDIPKSDGGDWSKKNIYLICANCNLSMGDEMSISDYKVKLYVKKLESLEEKESLEEMESSEEEKSLDVITNLSETSDTISIN